MSRKIYITSDMALDNRLMDIAETDQEAALIWPWFLTMFDDWGRTEADPRRIKAQTFPSFPGLTAQRIAAITDIFVEAGIIVRYHAKGKAYLCIPTDKWFQYQTHIRGEKRNNDTSRFPAPPCADDNEKIPDDISSAQMRANARNLRENCASPSPSPSPSLSPSPSFSLAKEVVAEKTLDSDLSAPVPDAPPPPLSAQVQQAANLYSQAMIPLVSSYAPKCLAAGLDIVEQARLFNDKYTTLHRPLVVASFKDWLDKEIVKSGEQKARQPYTPPPPAQPRKFNRVGSPRASPDNRSASSTPADSRIA